MSIVAASIRTLLHVSCAFSVVSCSDVDTAQITTAEGNSTSPMNEVNGRAVPIDPVQNTLEPTVSDQILNNWAVAPKAER